MATCSGLAANGAKPDFGPNVMVFTPSMPAAAMQQQIDKVYAIQRKNEFGPQRNALLFLPGKYHVDVPIGFYTEVMGLAPPRTTSRSTVICTPTPAKITTTPPQHSGAAPKGLP
jgi:hypothetical protein